MSTGQPSEGTVSTNDPAKTAGGHQSALEKRRAMGVAVLTVGLALICGILGGSRIVQLIEPSETQMEAAYRCHLDGGVPWFTVLGRRFAQCSLPDGTEVRSVRYFTDP